MSIQFSDFGNPLYLSFQRPSRSLGWVFLFMFFFLRENSAIIILRQEKEIQAHQPKRKSQRHKSPQGTQTTDHKPQKPNRKKPKTRTPNSQTLKGNKDQKNKQKRHHLFFQAILKRTISLISFTTSSTDLLRF